MPSENSPEMRRREENARKNKNSSRPATGSLGQLRRDTKSVSEGLKKQGFGGSKNPKMIWESRDASDLAAQARKSASEPKYGGTKDARPGVEKIKSSLKKASLARAKAKFGSDSIIKRRGM
jgi:hypothetical protein